MKQTLLACVLVSLGFSFTLVNAQGTPAGAPNKPLQQIAAEVRTILSEESINNIFDLFLRIQSGGISWQSTLVAPNDLMSRLSVNQLRMYAGVKLFDAVYAATFSQRQAVADAVRAIELIQDKLDLRSHADLSGKIFQTLKKAAADPASVKVQQLLDQMAADYVKDLPALLSDPVSAEFLVNSIYGFTIEYQYILGYFFQNERDGKLSAIHQRQRDRDHWAGIMIKVFQAFGRMGDKIKVSGETMQKIAVLERIVAAYKADVTTIETPAVKAAWKDVYSRVGAIRKGILTPGAN